MTKKTFVRSICAAVLLLGWAVGIAVAQVPADLRTVFTFSGPVSVPGVTLPAGKYLFRIADHDTRGVVQVLSGDGKTPYAMFFAYRAQRMEPSTEPEIQFMETAAGMPRAVRTWWHAAERGGYEFVYPKEQARLLAKGTGEPVLATQVASPKRFEAAPIGPPDLSRIAPSGEETKFAEATPSPAAPRSDIAAGVVAPAGGIAAGQAAALPKTASAAPLIGLAGIILLLGAGLIRVWRVMDA